MQDSTRRQRGPVRRAGIVAAFVGLAAGGAVAAPPQDMGEAARDFVAAEGYCRVESGEIPDLLRERLPPEQRESVRPFERAGPWTVPILLLEGHEGPAEPARYRMQAGFEWMEGSPPGRMRDLHFVQIDRFEPSDEDAGDGNDGGAWDGVSWRMVMSPIQGFPGHVVAASRRSLDASAIEQARCLEQACTDPEPLGDRVTQWRDNGEGLWDFVPPSLSSSPEGAPAPAFLLGSLLDTRPGQLEARESVGFAEPFAEAVVEVGLEEPGSVDILLRDGDLMDHELEAIWQRLSVGPDAQIRTAWAVDRRPPPPWLEEGDAPDAAPDAAPDDPDDAGKDARDAEYGKGGQPAGALQGSWRAALVEGDVPLAYFSVFHGRGETRAQGDFLMGNARGPGLDGASGDLDSVALAADGERVELVWNPTPDQQESYHLELERLDADTWEGRFHAARYPHEHAVRMTRRVD
ncbi:hypothetical protein D893_01212 [Thioalkalivibrio sp. ALE21]|nr:hypothetical protein [Thioalkalivibrio sp. ALE21]PYG02874.1 hypothetical protein D893_01212 [Thioalkalivibrio sp. ALE21]